MGDQVRKTVAYRSPFYFIHCPGCSMDFMVQKPKVGDRVKCSGCKRELEIGELLDANPNQPLKKRETSIPESMTDECNTTEEDGE